MDRWKFFGITHRDHLFCNPLSSEKVDEIIRLLPLENGGHVLDIACGKAEWLCRACEARDGSGVGLDLSPYEIDAAEKKIAERGLVDRVRVVLEAGGEFASPAESFDMTSCLGASWIWDGHRGTLRALSHWTKHGGLVVVGEPFGRRPPPESALSTDEGKWAAALVDHADNVRIGQEEGLTYLYSMVSSEDDWDRYQGLQSRAAELYAIERPDDPDLPDLMERARTGRDRYLEWGRATIGWAVYVFRKG